MKVSTKAKILLAEATATSLVGLINTGAGIILTYGLAFYHLRFDKKSPLPHQPPAQQVVTNSASRKDLCDRGN